MDSNAWIQGGLAAEDDSWQFFKLGKIPLCLAAYLGNKPENLSVVDVLQKIFPLDKTTPGMKKQEEHIY